MSRLKTVSGKPVIMFQMLQDEELKAKKVEGFVKDILAHLKDTAGITLRG